MTWMTPKMGIRSPSEWEDPFWDSDVLRMTDLDDWLLANAEDKNQIIIGDFDFDSGTDTLSWASTINIVNPRQNGLIQVLTSSVTIADGQFAYLLVPRPYNAAVLTMQVGSPPIVEETAVPIAYRFGNALYIKGRGVLGIGTHAPQHELGGFDQLDVTGLSGILVDPQNANRLRVEVRNVSGVTLTKGKLCYVDDADSGLPTIELADPEFFDTSRIIGMLETSVLTGFNGFATIYGPCAGCVDTSLIAEGTLIYLAPNGDFTETRPTGGDYPVIVGRVTVSASPGDVLITPGISQYTAEVVSPTGFPDGGLSDLVYLFTDLTRELDVTHVSDDHIHFYQSGTKYAPSSATITIPDVEGTHLVYYDTDDTLVDVINPTDGLISEIIRLYTTVCYIYWDATNKEHLYLGREPHSFKMPTLTHTYLHFQFGARWSYGLSLADFDIGNGDNEAHAQFSVSAGAINDEDLFHTIDAYGATEGVSVIYRDGSGGYWRRDEVAGFSVKSFVGGDGLLAFNEWTGVIWQQTEVNNNDYVLAHIWASNDSFGKGLLCIQGQHEYATLALARQGAIDEIGHLVTSGFPTQEALPVATVIFQTGTGYANSVKARIVEVESGVDYINWLVTEVGPGTPPSSHLNLTDLTNGDAGHTQLVVLGGRAGGQTLVGGTFIGEDLTLQDNIVDGNTVPVTKLLAVAYDGSGLLSGGLITQNGGDPTHIDISNGNGRIVDWTNPNSAVVTPVAWTGLTDITLTNIATEEMTAIFIDNVGSVIQRTTTTISDLDLRKLILLGVVMHTDNLTITGILSEPTIAYSGAQDFRELMAKQGLVNIGGNVYGPNGVNLNIDRSAGQLGGQGINFHSSKNQPSLKNTALDIAATFDIGYNDGSNGIDMSVSQTTNVTPSVYNPGGAGSVVAVPVQRWTIQRIYTLVGGETIVMLGEDHYKDAGEAVLHVGRDIASETTMLSLFGCLRCYLVVKNGATDLSVETQAIFDEAAGGGGGTSGGEGEVNTASNQGVGGVGPFDNKNGTDLEFRNSISANNILTIVLNAPNKEVVYTIVEANIDHDALANFVANEHIDWTQSQGGSPVIHPDNYVGGGSGGPNVGFFGYRAVGNQALASGLEVLIVVPDKVDDDGGDFNTSTYQFTAPTVGRYVFACSIEITIAASGIGECRIYRNSTRQAEASDQSNVASTVKPCVAVALKLDAGDTVEVRAWENTGFAATLQNNYLHFTGVQIVDLTP